MELDSYDVGVLPMKDVPHNSVESRSTAWHLDPGTGVQGLLELKTHAACGNILQITDSPCCASSAVAPN
jgi:hypothetical protein